MDRKLLSVKPIHALSMLGLLLAGIFHAPLSQGLLILQRASITVGLSALKFLAKTLAYHSAWFGSFQLLGRAVSEKRNWAPYSCLALSFTAVFLMQLYYPSLEVWGTTRALAGFTGGAVSVLVGHRTLQQLPKELRSSYFGLYLITSHLGNLLSQTLLGSSGFSARHNLVSLLSTATMLVVFPRAFQLIPLTETETPSLQLRLKPSALQAVQQQAWFTMSCSFFIGWVLSCLSVFQPLHSIEGLRLFQGAYVLIPLILALSGTVAQPLLAIVLGKLNARTVLRLQLCCIICLELILIRFHAFPKLFFSLLFLVGIACHGLYPVLLLHSFLLGLEHDEAAIPQCFKQYVAVGDKVGNALRWIQVTAAFSLLSGCIFGYNNATFYLISCYAPLIFYAFSSPKPEKPKVPLEEKLKRLPGGERLAATYQAHRERAMVHFESLRTLSASFKAIALREARKRCT